MNAIKVSALTKSYGKARGIKKVALEVGQGDFFGFIGPNGAGKSTTIRILLGLIRADSGSAEIFGRKAALTDRENLSRIGYLPSEASFYSGMKVEELLRFSAQLRGKDCAHKAGELCERLRLDGKKKIRELSFGSRKKAAIVCALQHEPELCILDEPTSGLDPLMQREFFSILQERNRAGATIFLSSHVLSEIQRYCRRAAVIKEGEIIACDRVEAMTQTRAKRVVIHGVKEVPPLPGIRDICAEGEGLSFLYSGDINLLTGALAKLPLQDLSLSEPRLEEVFMHYYAENGERA